MSGVGRGYSQKNCAWLCVPLPNTLTLLTTKLCGLHYSIYDLTKNVILYSYHHCSWHSYPKHNLWRAIVDDLIENDEKVASSKKKHSNSRLECKNHTLFMTKTAKIDTQFMTKTAENFTAFRAARYPRLGFYLQSLFYHRSAVCSLRFTLIDFVSYKLWL